VFAKQFVQGPPAIDVCPAVHVIVHAVASEVWPDCVPYLPAGQLVQLVCPEPPMEAR